MAPKREQDDGRVSLEGLDPEEALRALLAVDPESEPVDADDQGESQVNPEDDA